MKATVISKLCIDLNNQRVRPPMQHVAIEGPTNQFMKVVVRESYADNPLVVGPRYQPNDFRLSATKLTGMDTSGVMVCGINDGNKLAFKLRNAKCTRFYKVKGILGQATDNYFYTGKIVEKSTYKHVKHGHIDRVCSSMQSSHQRKMFELCGIDMQSQAAYELAVKGLLRPSDPNIPMIYTIRCVHFSPPEFTLEIVCINEYEMYLKTIVHDVGMQLRSTATCTQILCIQDGLFTLDHALLTKHWDLVSILSSISVSDKILAENKDLLYQQSPTLVEYDSTSKFIPFKKESSQI
ncbi:putative tRNA pseudouridine synthase 2 [Dufourea novaeangliae]|uniref:Putative tRNA pseudouridine synthase 2 n=1 Tax=Dufourea novaeangliae TaxID=178035 RepID=A0A154P9F8_DUFNO|nr:putative tRNA pseudouridine synthase 2 [Dufourea novaeangliae]